MTQDEIIELAKQAGFERLGHTDKDWVCYPEDIEAFAKLVARAERKEWETEFAANVGYPERMMDEVAKLLKGKNT